VLYNPKAEIPNKSVSTMLEVACEVGDTLEAARAKYAEWKLKLPSSKTTVVIGEFDESQADSALLNNYIYLTRSKMSSSSLIKNEAAHELFHIVQFQYDMQMTLYFTIYWFAEGTPDYVALRVFPEARSVILKPQEFYFNYEYFQEPWYKGAVPHAYSLVFLLDYLTTTKQLNLSVKDLWEKVQAGFGNTTKFTDYISEISGGKPFATVWSEYVDWSILDPSSLLFLREEQPQPANLDFDSRELTPTLNEFSAAVYNFKNASAPATYTISLPNGRPSQTTVTVALRNPNKTGKAPGETVTTYDLSNSVTVSLASNQFITIIAKNNKTSAQTLKIQLNKPDNFGEIFKRTKIDIRFSAVRKYHRDRDGAEKWLGANWGNYLWMEPGISWNGSQFSYNYNVGSITKSYSGNISSSTKTLSLTINYSDTSSSFLWMHTNWEYKVNDIPFEGVTFDGKYRFASYGSDLQSKISGEKGHLCWPDIPFDGNYVATDWTGTIKEEINNRNYEPAFSVEFLP